MKTSRCVTTSTWLNRTIATWKEGDTLPTLSYQALDISKMELPPGFRGYGVKNYIENPESAKRQAEVDAIRAKMEAEGRTVSKSRTR